MSQPPFAQPPTDWDPAAQPPDQPPAPPAPGRRGLAPRTVTLLVSGAVAVVMGAVMFTLPVPYILESPGPALDTLGDVDGKKLVSVEDTPSHPVTGKLLLTTVSALGSNPGDLSLPQLAAGYFRGSDALIPYDLVYPSNLTREDREQQSADEMAGSQDTATGAALEYLGYKVTPVVAAVAKDSPSAGKLAQGDKIMKVGDQAVSGYAQLLGLLDQLDPEQPVEIGVERDGQPVTVEIKPGSDSQGHARLGVSVDMDFPVKVSFGVQDIGGPSAGTMFALAIVDQLGPDDLAAGKVVAGTGTMSANGEVGPIGGIRQKMIGARSEGATVFLAPKANCDEVAGHVPEGMRVVAVETLAGSVEALKALASDAEADLPTCQAG